MYFEQEQVETGPSCSQKLATFFKYYMPLNKRSKKERQKKPKLYFALQGWYIITYGLGIYHLNLFIAFLTPKIDPALDFDGNF